MASYWWSGFVGNLEYWNFVSANSLPSVRFRSWVRMLANFQETDGERFSMLNVQIRKMAEKQD